MSPRDVGLAAIFSSLTSVGAMLSFPIGPVPITLQTFFVYLSGGLLGPKIGVISQIIYLLMGLVGLPVFSGFHSGPSTLIGPTAGYLFAFPLCSFISGFGKGKGFLTSLAFLSLGTIPVYASGLLWLSMFVGYRNSLWIGLFPFIPGDSLKIILAAYVMSRRAIRSAVDRASF